MRKTTKLRQKLQISQSDVICALRYYFSGIVSLDNIEGIEGIVVRP